MNQSGVKAAKRLVPQNYVEQAMQASKKHQNLICQLLEQRKCPKEGWDDSTINALIQQLAAMDSNNYLSSCGVGEREARFASDIVSARHFKMGHGIGRSGDITEPQPKAAGSSLVNVLANSLVMDIIKQMGVPNTQACFILPLATGMSLTLCLLTLRRRNPKARYVLWPRIDQKSCLKCSLTAGFELVVVEPLREGDELHTNLPRLTELLQSMDPGSVACILSTTSCFAPRAPDDVVAIAKLCKKADVPHIINNAYGLQCPVIMGNIAKAARRGRVDAFIQSTDKNFMVPVGGAIVAGFDVEFISAIGKTYPGRGSACPSMDVLITLLSLGLEGYQKLLVSRKSMFIYLAEQLRDLAARYQERLLETPSNTISIGITLTADNAKSLTELGSMLFSRLVSGSRVVVPGGSKDVEGIQLEGWGSHCPNYPTAYLTAAAAIGITKKEIDQFISKFEKILHKFKEKHLKNMIALTPPEVEDSQQKLKVTPPSKWSNTPRGSWKKKDRRRKKSGETQPTDGDHQSPPESSVLNSSNSDPDQSIVNNSLDISTNGLPQQEI